ncbi:MAG: phosphoribosylformylglycinamidine cyclo-ligase [Euryarchaeota archaeon]|uniref:Phosphoribosylformylglycinamidine cyclo-ligase n=1 Tax=Marine Group III euryarchaeote CG-Epi2 TaxID=1888996 RepID=A0A1J5UDY5_9ARCH|nr:phosphoribosylformylglycinamidine cyclo-ligase [Euryarchaeota archaeon]OIR22518.1 MAG: phosphoribosylformylglycinamidine cyclo-ligase [Marine Group III euryarchaeote CG-Epi2]|tara:strand:- start:510 stop:1487 length:978 start_codon:yes stop_codon:yes gene_type:complete
MVSTYSEAGVDIDASERATEALIAQIKSVNRKGDGEAIKLDNGFAGLVKLGDGALAMCTDGVGSKLLLAEEMDSIHTVGIDCVAMNTNDLICVGAEPLSFVDYIALDKPDEKLMAKIGMGLAEGCKQSNCTLSGGETAILPELVHGFDIAGTSVGYVKQDKIIDGTKISEGDILIGLKSSGPHSNGYTLIRKLFDGDKDIGKQLVEPTRIYVKEVMNLIKQVEVHGIAHITGGGLDNINRINDNFQYLIDNPLPVPPVFDWLQEKGSIEDKEMYRTFNMGMGMIIIVNKNDAEKSVSILGEHAQIIGSVRNGKGVEHKQVATELA